MYVDYLHPVRMHIQTVHTYLFPYLFATQLGTGRDSPNGPRAWDGCIGSEAATKQYGNGYSTLRATKLISRAIVTYSTYST
jgi:hypothetical protein